MDYHEGYVELLAERSDLKAQNAALLAVVEELHSFAVGCARHVRGRASQQRAQQMFDRAREAIAKAKGGE